MQFLKLWILTLIGSILTTIVLIFSFTAGVIAWAIIPPIAHIFTPDGNKYTADLLSSLQNKFNPKKDI